MEKYTKSQLDRVSKMILSEQAISGKDLLSQEKAKKAQGGKTIAQKLPKDAQLPTPEEMTRFFSAHKHEILGTAAIAAFLIPPPVGPLISAGISGADAALYWNEGDKYTGGFMAMLSVLPFLGIAAKIPGLAQLGAAGTKALAGKLAQIQKGLKPVLTKTEQEIVKAIGANKAIVAKQTAAYLKKKAATVTASKAGKLAKGAGKQVASYKISKNSWDWVYVNSGIQQAQINTLIEPSLKQLSKLVATREGKLSIETIIREEIKLAKEQLTITPKPQQNNTTTNTNTTNPQATTTPGSKTGDALEKLFDTDASGKLAIGIVAIIGAFSLYKGYRIAKFKIKQVRNAFNAFSKGPAGFIKSWKEGKVERAIRNTDSFKRLSKREQEQVLQALRNPQAMTHAVALSIDDMADQFMAGKISAADLKAVLPAESLARYGKIIDKIERNRMNRVNIPKGIQNAAEKPVVKPAPRVSYTMTPKK